jgi:hypothetical protein
MDAHNHGNMSIRIPVMAWSTGQTLARVRLEGNRSFVGDLAVNFSPLQHFGPLTSMKAALVFPVKYSLVLG